MISQDNSLDKKIAEDFWIKKLQMAEEHSSITPLFTMGNIAGEKAFYSVKTDRAIIEKVRRITQDDPATKFVYFLAVAEILLLRYTGYERLLMTSAANSLHTGTEDNLLFFYTDISAADSFKQVLGKLKQELNEMLPYTEYSHASFRQRYQAINGEKKKDLYAPSFAYNKFMPANHLLEKSSLLITINEQAAEDITVEVSYDNRYPEVFIRQLMECYHILLNKLSDQPDLPVKDINILSLEMEQQVLVRNNDTVKRYNHEGLLHKLFEEQVRRTPSATALIYEDLSYTYEELNKKANQLAAFLTESYEVKPEYRIGIMMERSDRMIINMLGILKAGAVYVPVDPNYPKEHINYLFEDAGICALMIDSTHMFSLGEFDKPVFVSDMQLETLEGEGENVDVHISPGNLAYIIYTSGSTGKPKGVAVEHRNICNTLAWRKEFYGMDVTGVNLQIPSFAFDSSVEDIFSDLIAGGCVVIPLNEKRNEISYLRELIVKHGINHMLVVPSLYRLFLSEMAPVLKKLKWVTLAGEAIPFSLMQEHFKYLPEVALYNEYGPTENAVCATAGRLYPGDEQISIGKPVANTFIYLLDEYMQPVPYGARGELCIAGMGTARGYIGKDGLTAEKFVPLPLAINGEYTRMYRTGDLAAWLPGGNLLFLGRKDNQVKIRGNRIELEQVEYAISKVEGIREVVVMVREEDEDQKYLAAYYTAGTAFTEDQLRKKLMEQIPYYMIPGYFVHLPQLPVKPNGKVDRARLPMPQVKQVTTGYVAPRNELEEKLVVFWKEVLNIATIGIHDNFFSLGGDSIKGIRITNKIQDLLGEVIHLATFFEAPTIALFSEHLSRYKSQQHTKVDARKIERFRAMINKASIPPLPASRNESAVFLLSPPRSGSTLLRIILSGNKGLFVPPELEMLEFNSLRERNVVFTEKFSFYQEGLTRAVMELRNCNGDEAAALLKEYEKQDISIKELYRMLQDWAAERNQLLVDKTAYYAIDENILHKAETWFKDAKYIHLIRNPYACIYSYERQKADQLFRYDTGFNSREVAELIWLISQENILSFLDTVPAQRKLNVYLEELVKEPERVVRQICDFMEVPFDINMLNVYSGESSRMLDGVHKESRMIGDNRFFQHKSIDPAVADEWKKHHKEDFLGEETIALAGRLGYENELNSKKDGIVPVGKQQHYPVSYAQRRLWILHQFKEASTAYNISLSLSMNGILNVEALESAIMLLINRHEILRTTFIETADDIRQVVHDHVNVEDMIRYEVAGSNTAEISYAEREARHVFDLGAGPLVRVAIVKMAEDRHLFFLTMHHIVADAWSLEIISRELIAAYNAINSNHMPQLAPLKVHYKDYAHWQASSSQDEHKQYWTALFSGELPVTQLQGSHVRPAVKTYNGNIYTRTLSQDIRTALHQLAKSNGTTVFNVLMAFANVLIYRYTGAEDLIIGTPVTGRENASLEGQVGFYLNMLPLRNNIDPSAAFETLLETVSSNNLQAFRHKDYPFDQLVEDLQLERDTSRSPLFDIVVTYQQEHAGLQTAGHAFDGLHIQPAAGVTASSKFDLTFIFREETDGLRLIVEYNTDIFEKEFIQRLTVHLEQLMLSVKKDVHQPIGYLDLMPASEREVVLQYFNRPVSAQAENGNILHEFVRQAKSTPQATAVATSTHSLTYEELDNTSGKVAAFLSASGIGRGAVVALVLHRTVNMLPAVLGVMKSGAAFLPVDPSFPEGRIRYMMEDAAPAIVLTEKELEEALHTTAADNTFLSPANNDLAYVIYTSGSTGTPKGVMITHYALFNFIKGMQELLEVKDGASFIATTTYSFDIAWLELLLPLTKGGTAIIMTKEETLNAFTLIEHISTWQPAYLQATPSYWQLLLDCGWKNDSGTNILVGGEQLPVALKDALTGLGKGRVWNMYGPTETTIWSTAKELRQEEEVTIGRPLKNTLVYILDKQRQLVPPGVTGELYIGGDGVAAGYLNKPEQTAERFITYEGIRLYGTGDRAVWLADGDIRYCGRMDEQVKIRGYRIEPAEIVTAAMQLPYIKQFVVVPRTGSDGNKYLAGYMVLRDAQQQPAVTATVLSHLRSLLPEYMVPAVLITLDEMPLTANGKVDKKALPETQVTVTKEYIAPQGAVEELLTTIWQQLLKKEKISVDDNFFSLGGHSLLAVKVVNSIRLAFGIDMAVGIIFELNDIRSLARYITLHQQVTPAQQDEYEEIAFE